MKKILVIVFLFISFIVYAENPKPKLAVMEFVDISQEPDKLDKSMLLNAAEDLRGDFVSSNRFDVIAMERQRSTIKSMKKKSYSLCRDKSCQIPLGKALSADTILSTTINCFGGIYTITVELINLAKEVTDKAAKFEFDGTEQGLQKAVKNISKKLAPNIEEPKDEEVKEDNADLPVVSDDAGSLNVSEKYHPYWKGGVTMIALGVGLILGGVTGFELAANSKFDAYNSRTTDKKIFEAITTGISQEDYLKSVNKYKDKGDLYNKLAIVSGLTGGALIISGIITAAVTKDRGVLKKVSFSTDGKGLFAGLRFEF